MLLHIKYIQMLFLSVLSLHLVSVAAVEYTIGVMFSRGDYIKLDDFTAVFGNYLSTTLAKDSISFRVILLNPHTANQHVEQRTVDFVFVSASVYSCLEAEFGLQAITSQITTPLQGQEVAKFGGAIIKRADRMDIKTLDDIVGKIVEAGKIHKLGSCQLQWDELQRRNISFLQDPEQVRFANKEQEIVHDVISGAVDIGFIETAVLEKMEQDGDIHSGILEVLEPKSDVEYPFQTNTHLVPNWPLAALNHVSADVIGIVARALADINSSHPMLSDNPYTRWGPPHSYLYVNHLQQNIGWFSPSRTSSSGTHGSCIKSRYLFKSIVCPAGYVKLPEAAMTKKCADSGLQCPLRYSCVCKPCAKLVDEQFSTYLRVVAVDTPWFEPSKGNILSAGFSKCTKLNVCTDVGESVKSNAVVEILIVNNWISDQYSQNAIPNVSSVSVEYVGHIMQDYIQIKEASESNALFIFRELGTYQARLNVCEVDNSFIEVKIDGVQTESSPIMIKHVEDVDLTTLISVSDDNTDNINAILSSGITATVVILIVGTFMLRRRFQKLGPVDFETRYREMLNEGEICEDLSFRSNFRVPKEIKRSALTLVEELGKGNFGLVWKGTLNEVDIHSTPGYIVAVKMALPKVNDKRIGLIDEATIMALVSGHPNIVSLVGVVTIGEPKMLVVQYCDAGDLQSTLRTKCSDGHCLSLNSKIIIASEIASGMTHLVQYNVVHRDLSTRNIMLQSSYSECRNPDGLVAKITDFGLGRQINMDNDTYYHCQSGIYPIRWTAPEAITSLKFTTESDVWSFGIVLIELFQDGETPYSDLENHIVLSKMLAGEVHDRPQNCPQHIYDDLIFKCFSADPRWRPQFCEIVDILSFYVDDNGRRISCISNDVMTILSGLEDNQDDNDGYCILNSSTGSVPAFTFHSPERNSDNAEVGKSDLRLNPDLNTDTLGQKMTISRGDAQYIKMVDHTENFQETEI